MQYYSIVITFSYIAITNIASIDMCIDNRLHLVNNSVFPKSGARAGMSSLV